MTKIDNSDKIEHFGKKLNNPDKIRQLGQKSIFKYRVDYNLPNVLCGIPSLTGKLSAMRIIYGWMENRNAQITVLQNKAMNKHLITNAPDADNYLVLNNISKLQKVGQCFNRKFILNQNSIFGSKLDIYLIDIWMPHLSDKSNTWW